jgi:hypothetical protein
MIGNVTQSRSGNCSLPVQQIARIGSLLEELEQLSHCASHVPLPLLVQARHSIEKARDALKSCMQIVHGAPAESVIAGGDQGDPQPDVDRDMLDRLYYNLKAGRRPPEL